MTISRGLMLDSAYAPSAPQLATARRLIPELVAWGGYLPSPGAFHIWSADDFHRVTAAGLEVLPFFVTPQLTLNAALGRRDGHQAAAQAAAYGLPGPICFDVEPNVWALSPAGAGAYLEAAAAVVRSFDRACYVYGGRATCLAAAHDGYIVASYPAQVPVNPDPNPLRLAVVYSGWQFRGTHDVPGLAGISVDASQISLALGAGPVPPAPRPPVNFAQGAARMIEHNPITGLWETVCRGHDDDGIWWATGTTAQLKAGAPGLWARLDGPQGAQTPAQPSIAVAGDGSAVIECVSEDHVALFIAERTASSGPAFGPFEQLNNARTLV